MPEFSFALPGVSVTGVCATDATEETIHAAVAADVLAGAPVGQERRLDEAQIVYTAVSTATVVPTETDDALDAEAIADDLEAAEADKVAAALRATDAAAAAEVEKVAADKRAAAAKKRAAKKAGK